MGRFLCFAVGVVLMQTPASAQPAGVDTPPVDTLGAPFFENDVIGVGVAMDISLLVTTFVASWGVVDGVDLSVAVPVVHTSVQGSSVATMAALLVA